MDIVTTAEVPVLEPLKGPVRPGSTIRQTLLGDEAEDGLNFKLGRNQEGFGDEAFQTPRHRHAFQQIRWTESGSVNFAPGQDIAEGDIAYFPRGTHYGPQLKDQGVQFLLQFGFGDEFLGGKDWYRVLQEGTAALSARGTFKDGIFSDIDPETGKQRNRDAVAALYEERTGKKIEIPNPGYEAPILMHPKAFSYYQAALGVEIRHLGRYQDHPGPNADVRISMLRLSDNGIHLLRSDRAQVAWSISAGLRIDGRAYPKLTCLYSPRGHEDVVSGVDGVELFVVELPRLD